MKSATLCIEESKRERGRVVKCNECGEEWHISKEQNIPKRGYVCPHCSNKKNKQRKHKARIIAEVALKYLAVTILGIVLYLNTAEAAEITRGYKAYGGECLLLLLPIWWFFIETSVRDIEIEVVKEEKIE